MKIICPKCKGKGELRAKIDWALAVFTFGLSALMDASDWEECNICDGTGFVNDND